MHGTFTCFIAFLIWTVPNINLLTQNLCIWEPTYLRYCDIYWLYHSGIDLHFYAQIAWSPEHTHWYAHKHTHTYTHTHTYIRVHRHMHASTHPNLHTMLTDRHRKTHTHIYIYPKEDAFLHCPLETVVMTLRLNLVKRINLSPPSSRLTDPEGRLQGLRGFKLGKSKKNRYCQNSRWADCTKIEYQEAL